MRVLSSKRGGTLDLLRRSRTSRDRRRPVDLVFEVAIEVIARDGELRRTGTTVGRLERMATFDEVNRVVGLPEADAWERSIQKTATDGS